MSERELQPSELSETKRRLLEKYLRGDGVVSAPQLNREETSGPSPLSFGQQQLWLLAQMAPDVPYYNECVTVHIHQALDVDIFERCFAEVIRRHEAWRTTFTVLDGQPHQIIQPATRVTLSLKDLTSLPSQERQRAALKLAADEAAAPFDLSQGPLLRPLLIKLDRTEYKLYLAMHHIIFDGVSIHNVLLPELAALYDAYVQGRPSPLPDPPARYVDYARWQRDRVERGEFDGQMTYWREKLNGDLPVVNLPTDHPRPAIQTFNGAWVPLAIPSEVINALRLLARREDATLYMALAAAVEILLFRYTAQEDMLVAAAVSDRGRSEFEGLMGYFLNTVVLRTDLTGDPTFVDLLGRMREVTLGAFSNKDIPFELLMRELHPERDTSRNPITQVMLTIEPKVTRVDDRWDISQLDVQVGAVKFDLAVELDERDDGLIGRFEYNTDLFERATIERMVRHFTRILQAVIQQPDAPISALPMLTDGERAEALGGTVEFQPDFVRKRPIHRVIEEQARTRPGMPAVSDGERSLTYRELDRQSNQLARSLHARGVRGGRPVGVCIERSVDAIVAMLGILKAGAPYVPLDPTYPPDRLRFLAADADLALLVTNTKLASRVPGKHRVLCLDADAAELERHPDEPLSGDPDLSDLAYIIYTSGSTGEPKGVMIEHGNLLAEQAARTRFYSDHPSAFLLLSSFSFDSSVAGIFWTLCSGGMLVIASEDVQRDPAAVDSCIREKRISHLLTVPSLYLPTLEHLAQDPPSTFRLAVVAGERCPPELVSRHQTALPGVALFNEYGPTETTVWATAFDCSHFDNKGAVPIGRPVPGVHAYVLGPHSELLPVGVPGELYIGGAGVARGYLHRPQLTAERFLPNPFAPEDRVYRTGDRVRRLSSGNLDFLGRLDDQITMRGYRIEPAEIEAVLTSAPGVIDCAISVRDDLPAGGPALVGYVVAEHEHAVDLDTVRTFLRDRLPRPIVPSVFVVLPKLPRSHNGKVDRAALPSPRAAQSQQDTRARAAAYTATERALAAIWSELLHSEHVGPDDNFFDVGGHSLLVAQMIPRVKAVFQVNLPFITIFENPTLSALAQCIDSSKKTDNVRPARIGAGSRDRHRISLSADSG